MKETRIIMGMPVTIHIVDAFATPADIEKVFAYFMYVDEKFSPFKKTSELTLINEAKIKEADYSADMQEVFKLSEETKKLTGGYFDIKKPSGLVDTSGLVKGWAIYKAANILKVAGFKNYFVDAGGDIQVAGKNSEGNAWSIGIKDPFDETQQKVVKVVYLKDEGIATSGTYIRGDHIYNPHDGEKKPITDIISLTVIGPNVYEADRFATAAFAMGKKGIYFIEKLAGFEAYMIDKDGIGTETSGFEKYTKEK